MKQPSPSADTATERYESERRQGKLIADGAEDAWGWTSPAGRLRADARARFLIESAGLAPGVRCLELGAGTGEFTERLVRSGCALTAIELSEHTAALCRERVGASVEVIVGNIETGEGLEDRRFDSIVGVSVLHHVNLDLTFDSTFSHLAPGGRFAFSEPNMANPQIWLERNVELVRRLRHVTPHETAFRRHELRERFEQAGLVVTQCEPFDFLHPSTPRPLVPFAARVGSGLERTPLRGVGGSLRIAGHRPPG